MFIPASGANRSFYNKIVLPSSSQAQDHCSNLKSLMVELSALEQSVSDGIQAQSGGKEHVAQLGLAHRLFWACVHTRIQTCHNRDCNAFGTELKSLMPRTPSWPGFQDWALQLAACLCSRYASSVKARRSEVPGLVAAQVGAYRGLGPMRDHSYAVSPQGSSDGWYSVKMHEELFQWAGSIDLAEVLVALSWLKGLVTGRYEVLQEPIEFMRETAFYVQEGNTGGIYTDHVMQAIGRARRLGLCPGRVWALCGSIRGRELALPALIPRSARDVEINQETSHERCTFDFCETSSINNTSIRRRHECAGGDCRRTLNLFQPEHLSRPIDIQEPTAWKLDGSSILDPSGKYMAISHVWADGTGTGGGSTHGGEVNSCLHDFFAGLAAELGCDGLWWDTVCIPGDLKRRRIALENMHRNYERAHVTLVHDLGLRSHAWVDAERASFAILMSAWFTRGWTALELARSRPRSVKVLFKHGKGHAIKDLDDDILAQPGQPSSTYRQVATTLIHSLRQKIEDLDSLLMAMGPRYTSWQRDKAIISGHLVGLEILDALPVLPDLEGSAPSPRIDQEEDACQQEIYQRILHKLGKLSSEHMFHRSATMSRGFSWCPTTLDKLPMARVRNDRLRIGEEGNAIGFWGVMTIQEDLAVRLVWRQMNPLIKAGIQSAMKQPEKHLFLVEPHDNLIITQALIVKLMDGKDTQYPNLVHCTLVGTVDFQQRGGIGPVGVVRMSIGDVEGLKDKELENGMLNYLSDMCKLNETGHIHMATGSVGGPISSGLNANNGNNNAQPEPMRPPISLGEIGGRPYEPRSEFRFEPWAPGIEFGSRLEKLDRAQVQLLRSGLKDMVTAIMGSSSSPESYTFGPLGGYRRRRAMARLAKHFQQTCAELKITIGMPQNLKSSLRNDLQRSDHSPDRRLASLLWTNISDAKLRSYTLAYYIPTRIYQKMGLLGSMCLGLPFVDAAAAHERDTILMVAVLELCRALDVFGAP